MPIIVGSQIPQDCSKIVGTRDAGFSNAATAALIRAVKSTPSLRRQEAIDMALIQGANPNALTGPEGLTVLAEAAKPRRHNGKILPGNGNALLMAKGANVDNALASLYTAAKESPNGASRATSAAIQHLQRLRPLWQAGQLTPAGCSLA